VVVGRTVQLARVDPELARELFVRHALVEGDWPGGHHAFVQGNQARVEEVRALEDRVRRRDLLVGDDALFAFYDARVPLDVVSGAHFDRWWRSARRAQPDLLSLTAEDLLRQGAGEVDADAHPEVWHQGELVLPLRYTWDPGAEHDGVSVCVGVGQLAALRPDGFDWGIPAWREELVAALLRSLPKDLRRQVSPLGEHARAFLAAHGPGDGPLLAALAAHLRATAGVVVPVEAWDLERVPPHLRVTFAVTDRHGEVVVASHDLPALQARLARAVRSAAAGTGRELERTGLTAWSFGDLPARTEGTRAGAVVHGYPTLVDEGESVGVRIAPTPDEQAAGMQEGTRRLLALAVGSQRRLLLPLLTDRVKLALVRVGCAPVAAFTADCTLAAVDVVLDRHGGPVFEAAAFEALADRARAEVPGEALDVAGTAVKVVLAAAALADRLDASTSPKAAGAVADVRAQLDRLVGPGFVARTGARRLPDVARYLRAAEARLSRLPGDADRDRHRMAVVHALEAEHARAVAAWGSRRRPEALDDVRWMLEELRVGTFAQEVGTARPVSDVRVRRALAAVGAPPPLG
jgi:ATP-dependent helicase HrpA